MSVIDFRSSTYRPYDAGTQIIFPASRSNEHKDAHPGGVWQMRLAEIQVSPKGFSRPARNTYSRAAKSVRGQAAAR